MKTAKSISVVIFSFVILISSNALFAQVPVPSVEDDIIALTYKLWKAENENDMATRNKYIAEDYTEFNPGFSTRIDGREKNFKLTDAGATGITSLADEMLNPKVQVYGDVAILTYNFAGVTKAKDESLTTVKAKSTRVYVKMNGDWKLVHANFGMDPTEN